MAPFTDTGNIHAFNWHVYFIYYSVEFTFNELWCLSINEFLETNIIKIGKDEEIIKTVFPRNYLYFDILRKLEKCRNQILINIDYEVEYRTLETSQSVSLRRAGNNVEMTLLCEILMANK